MLTSSVDERAVGEVMIDLVGCSGENGGKPAISNSAFHHGGESKEEGNNKEEVERKKAKDRLVAYGGVLQITIYGKLLVAAVRQRMQALSGMIERKAFVSGLLSTQSNPKAQPWTGSGNYQAGVW
ncbi:UNVERIFIED_CONTAM: hypothetical protein Scaly_1817800 [Sesamum calycinum]|uniref:Uncharacterized protein n=1 Tax=Sesamum calycinum TaxID=2727403 RepID=A0AAW2NC12_9LAMI